MGFLTVIFKDLKLVFKKPLLIFIILIIPLFYIFIISFINNSSMENLTLYVDKNLKNQFSNKKYIKVNYMDKEIKIYLNYIEKNKLVNSFYDFKYPSVLIGNSIDNINNETYQNNKDNTENTTNSRNITNIDKKNIKINNFDYILYVNPSNQKSTMIYNLLNIYFAKNLNLNVKILKNENQMMLSLIINMLIIFGALTFSINSLHQEIENKTIFLLKKIGFNNFTIVIEKLIFVLIIEYIFFLIFIFVFNLVKSQNLGGNIFLVIPLITLNSAIIGLFIVSLFKEREIHSFIYLVFWIPTMFFPLIEDSISLRTKILFYLDPLTLSVLTLKKALINKIDFNLIYFNIVILIIFTLLTTYFLSKTLKKAI